MTTKVKIGVNMSIFDEMVAALAPHEDNLFEIHLDKLFEKLEEAEEAPLQEAMNFFTEEWRC